MSRRSRPSPVAAAADLAPRLPIVDLLRGVAVAMMIVYHFCYDLSWFGWADFHMLLDARWIAWRTAIVSSFLLLVGVGFALLAGCCGCSGLTWVIRSWLAT